MAGHSKWATTKRKKAVIDAKRGKIFTKLAKNITVAAKAGPDPDMNPALRTAIDQAKSSNMPKDNIEKAIAKGAGTGEGDEYQEVLYEGYGPGGAALIIECVTDNINRAVQGVRSTLTKHGGSLGGSGSVQYMFAQKGLIRIPQQQLANLDIDAIELAAIDAGAEDIETAAEGMTITTSRNDFHTVLEKLSEHGVTPADSSIEWVTENTVALDGDAATRVAELIDALEEEDDVQGVYTNVELPA